jgi:hypothetical protein
MPPPYAAKSSLARPEPPAAYASLVLGRAPIGGSLCALREAATRVRGRCVTINNHTRVGVRQSGWRKRLG